MLSSFECDGSIPSAFLSYISNTFTSEYRRSYGDLLSLSNSTFSTELNIFTQPYPNLTNVQINCVLGQPCQTLFEYDKQRGLDKQYPKENIFSGSDKIYPRENVFYCCPPMDHNQTIVKECNQAKSIIQKSAFRESRKPFLLEKVK